MFVASRGHRRRWPAKPSSLESLRGCRDEDRRRNAGVGARVEPGVELQLEVELVREHPAGLERALQEVLQALDAALGLRITRRAEMPTDRQLPQNAANASVGRAALACRPAWRSQTNVCGGAPNDHRQRL